MWKNFVDLSLSPANLFIRAIVVYVAVLFLLRISGKRQVGQMSAIEFVAVMLISNAVQNSMNGGDNSLVGGLILASTLIGMTWVISILTYRNRKLRDLFEGVPTLLIHKGKIVQPNMNKERITHSELSTLLRKQGIHNIHDIKEGILESDGSLSITRTNDLPPEILREAPHTES